MAKNSQTDDISEQPTTTEQTATTKKIKTKEQLIYIGPNIPGGILHKFTVFKGGMPEHINPLTEKYPVIKKMFVSVKDLSKTAQAATKKGTLENIFYEQIIELINKGGLK